MIEKNGTYYLVRENKTSNAATYKQHKYLTSFDNVDCQISTSQFTKYIDREEASEAIDLAKEGKNIIVE